MSDITLILHSSNVRRATINELLPLVYDELRLIAANRLAWEAPGQTLQATALVHEAYIRLANSKEPPWVDSGHFFRAAARVMKNILIDNARRKHELKNGGEWERIELTDFTQPGAEFSRVDLLELGDALERLERIDSRKAEVVHLRFFAGLTLEQVADYLGIGLSTAEKDWTYAKCWLKVEMSDDTDY
jgi:RNA polymerase sigma factor (TIGR02999 family)